MKRILVAPLDWGLGHAARCIPIIKYLFKKKCEVIIGADGRPLVLLQKEFPSLDYTVIPGYNIFYSENLPMLLNITSQIPKILLRIKREHDLLKKIISEKKIDAVISDNRFGMWNKDVPCVFITHQLMVKSPFGEKLIHQLADKFFISRYSECWIPDCYGKSNLSGDLAHKFPVHKNAKYIGPLSRFSHLSYSSGEKKNKNTLLVILSGPEPQRTVFEKKILEQIILLNKKILIVQGITEKNERRKISKNAEIVSHLTSEELLKEILSSDIILSRPGYSTIMDLAVLGRSKSHLIPLCNGKIKAIFVPTPGQTEQEYLAKELSEKSIAYSVSQKEFNLRTAIEKSEKYSGFTDKISGEEYKKTIDDFLSKL